MRSLAISLAVISLVTLQGCAGLAAELSRDPRDAAWDPKPGQRLFNQLPAWDGAGITQCGGWTYPDDPTRSKQC